MSVSIRVPRAPAGFSGPDQETLGSIARQLPVQLPV